MELDRWHNTLGEFGIVITGKYNDINDSYKDDIDDSYEEDLYSEVNEVNGNEVNVEIDINFGGIVNDILGTVCSANLVQRKSLRSITVSLNRIHETNKSNETSHVTTDVKANETVNELHETNRANETINEDKEFPNKHDLNNYYGIEINTIPDRYELKIRYIIIKGKMGCIN